MPTHTRTPTHTHTHIDTHIHTLYIFAFRPLRCRLSNQLKSSCSNERREDHINSTIDFVWGRLHGAYITPYIMNRLPNNRRLCDRHSDTRSHINKIVKHEWYRWSICPNTVRVVWDWGHTTVLMDASLSLSLSASLSLVRQDTHQ